MAERALWRPTVERARHRSSCELISYRASFRDCDRTAALSRARTQSVRRFQERGLPHDRTGAGAEAPGSALASNCPFEK